jgi:hypothetical protein
MKRLLHGVLFLGGDLSPKAFLQRALWSLMGFVLMCLFSNIFLIGRIHRGAVGGIYIWAQSQVGGRLNELVSKPRLILQYLFPNFTSSFPLLPNAPSNVQLWQDVYTLPNPLTCTEWLRLPVDGA